ncbi:MBL fold metallo-hydrolase [Streptomyces thermoviolaceus]|uniref:MBL fold metallo-hydrolase n=1 Tax=Streptomyces thermoviolaceus TaxID=1952 RepID=UPI0019BBB180|nr:MBL fold metallo-hydrolase [Streptomyces thermoviolaceus]MCM3267038.1 MBL fold metallo-hydrolase [Streptomyces thermoviolaceus]WTD48915.1 MBL fold metallo-hydrolase [Streptomyces thermoviolaceus]GHB08609.1 MBL fold metallo-hydrolase [Streptomyces thermoviolaceus subsp. thermoviolaceus]
MTAPVSAPDTQSPGSTPRLLQVADGVFAYVQPDGGWCLNNAGLVTGQGRGLLVDTAATSGRAEALRAAVLPVLGTAPELLVNTHAHGDHTFGNFRFPEAVVVAQERARTEMRETGLHLTHLWPDVDWGPVELVEPSVTFDHRLVLHLGQRDIELLHVGPAHTTGDTVVWLPTERVVFTGDVVMNGVTPFVPMGSIAGSLAALDTLRGLNPAVVVPGHGPVTDASVFDEVEGYLRLLRELGERGPAAGLSPLDLARDADLGPYADWIDAERIVPNLHRAYAEAQGAAGGSAVNMNELFAQMVEFHGGLPACHA